MAKHYLSVDLGASSGRNIVGSLDDGVLRLEELDRYWNGPTDIGGTLHWDFLHILRHIRSGIAKAKALYGEDLVSMGIDTWGVDFGLLDPGGKLLGNPVHYRDSRTHGVMARALESVPQEEIFSRTGIQFMEINTLYQLLSLSLTNATEYRHAGKLLFSPDLLNYWLTGAMVSERTIASTSQFYDPRSRDWALDLLERLTIRTDLLADLVDPGTVIGQTDGLPVVAVATHDTASAFAAVPVDAGEQSAFLSSGTWSLLGIEQAEPIIDADTLAANFTNEVGACGTICFFKNLSGLWIIQELKRTWQEDGHDLSWDGMQEMARTAEPFAFLIDPNDAAFAAPGDMVTRIKDYCEATNQPRPESPAQILRAVYDGLACLYAHTLESLERLSDRRLETIRIVGGGCRNGLLNQLTANATGRRVIAGPAEATAIGNLIVQMLAMGDIRSLQEGRDIVARSFDDEIVERAPQDVDRWRQERQRWRDICSVH